MAEASLHHPAQRPLTGVAEGSMSQVVSQRGSLSEILVKPQSPGHGTGDASHFQRVGHSGPVVVPLRLEEHLGLVLEPPERLAVDHSVNIPLKAGAYGTG